MKCPFCKKNDDRVVDSRSSEDGTSIRRRRECLDCGRRFTSYERIEHIPFQVIKKDGGRVEFNRDKIVNGILKACHKRPISQDSIFELGDEIESEIHNLYDKEVESTKIGELVSQKLKKLDKVAYVRFASVYYDFKDVNEFMSELRTILK
ncbi:MAG: transcriptional regulator NrdR [Planctomycetota bacterium]|nr:MAG: transcriptional regulator NrdR [Planctomycetota bacterium]